MKKKEIFKKGNDYGISNNFIERFLIKLTNLSKIDLFLIEEIDDKFIEKINDFFIRIQNGEPIEYVINNAEFYSLDFYVDSRVLIPRNDTEIMVDKAIETTILNEANTLIDVGTGSSCIAISILLNTSKINNAYFIDISKDALEVSKKNIEKHKLEKNIYQINGNLISDFLGTNDFELNKNIIITANLPYIKNNDFENMDKETIQYEPDIALYGGKETGFELYENLINEIFLLKTIHKNKKISLFIEIGFDQKEYASNFLEKNNLKYEIFKDNSGIDRCIKVEF